MNPAPAGPAPGDPEEIQQILFSFRGDLAFDIGGNWGVVAARLAENFTDVVSFEPADESYRILADTAARVPNLTAVQVAVTDHDGDVLLDVQEHSIRTGQLTTSQAGAVPQSLSDSTWGRVIDRRTVPAAMLNTLADRYGIPDFIKVDVEGHEDAVIVGGLSPDGNGLIQTHQPDLFIEIHSAELGELVDDLLRPMYGQQLHVVRHPHYPPRSWGHDNHYYLIAGPAAGVLAAPRRPRMALGRKEAAVGKRTRDIDGDYRNAYIAEYEGYVRVGRHEAAENVARLLREQYGHDVDAEQAHTEPPVSPEATTVETTAEARPPEAAVEPKPAAKKAAPRKTAAKKTTAAPPKG